MTHNSSCNKPLFIGLTILVLALSGCTSTKRTVKNNKTSNKQLQDTQEVQDNSPIALCKMSVSNPPASTHGLLNRKSKTACIKGLELLLAPAPNACLSSGFGKRNNRQHSGIDYQSKPAGNVIAAGSGKIIRVDFRLKDYGNWIIIDHGNQVYTSYAHLLRVEPGIKVGKNVSKGQTLGRMGNSGNATSAIHLHFELRIGRFENPKGWWGLKPIDPFKQKEKC